MELRRRHVFRGNASAFGGRIVRPEHVVLEMPGASSLSVVGGRSVSKITGTPPAFKDFVTFETASTFAEGLFDLKGAVALSNHSVREDSLKASTRVQADISKLTVGRRKRLTVDLLSAEMRSQSPTGSGEPRIALGEVIVEAVRIDGFELKIEIERGIFEKYDTHAKLLSAADEPEFVKKHGPHLFLTTDFEGRPAPRTGRLVPGGDTIYATIVKAIKWRGPANPAVRIDRNRVTVDDFGTIYFGELLITTVSRRLTLMRLELGSEEGGSGGGPDIDINGSWSP